MGRIVLSRILVLSDLHLCKRLSSVGDVLELRPLWQGFDELILNGDTEETYSKRCSQRSIEATRTLIQTAEGDGLQVHLLTGNHDPMISDRHYYSTHDGKILIFHGHAVFQEVTPWTWYGKAIASHRRKLIDKSSDTFESQLQATQIASDYSASGGKNKNKPSLITLPTRVAWSVLKVLEAWRKFPHMTFRWVSTYAPEAKFVIVGHTHHAGIWNVQDKVIINTGCFGFPSYPCAVVLENSNLMVFRIRKKNNTFCLSQELGSWQLEAL